MGESGGGKSERLVNLTMALLASRRFLTKSEIFKSVDGYQGSPETMERMFERDKNDLRELGLNIEVGSEDPLFEDEAGYRIDPSEYRLNLGELDQEELSLLSLAASKWQNSLFSKTGQTALRKIESLSAFPTQTDLSLPFYSFEVRADNFEAIWHAIEKRQSIRFEYSSLTESTKYVEPYRLGLYRGFWYLLARDVIKGEMRSYKLVRIAGEIQVDSKEDSFSIPGDFSFEATFLRERAGSSISAIIHLRSGQAHEIRALGESSPLNDDWDCIALEFTTKIELFELLARAMTSAVLQEPESTREEFVHWMKRRTHE